MHVYQIYIKNQQNQLFINYFINGDDQIDILFRTRMRKKINKNVKLTKQQEALQFLMHNSQIGNFSSLSTIHQSDWNQIKQDIIPVTKIKQKNQQKIPIANFSPQRVNKQMPKLDRKQFQLSKKSFQCEDEQVERTSRNSNIRKLLSLQIIHRKQLQQSPRGNQIVILRKNQQAARKTKIHINDFSIARQKISQLSRMKKRESVEDFSEVQKRQKFNSKTVIRYKIKYYKPQNNFLKTTNKFS